MLQDNQQAQAWLVQEDRLRHPGPQGQMGLPHPNRIAKPKQPKRTKIAPRTPEDKSTTNQWKSYSTGLINSA